jgi:hypothetical protein
MFTFPLNDPTSVLSGAPSLQFKLVRALKLMAIATAPSPGSRYQPGTSWGVVKYATAIEPRLTASHHQLAIANSGIWDLDPHQKTVLADDLGMGLALAAVDNYFGIDGLWDCYGMWLEGLLQLHTSGRHRRMPDFLILIRTPIGTSRIALLECKGSTRLKASQSQLQAACNQLSNVTSVLGVHTKQGSVPSIGVASTLNPGHPVVISVSDPPENLALPDDIEVRLRANYVALELAALGDVLAADRVRLRHNLPSWQRRGIEIDALPRSGSLEIRQTALSMLSKAKRLSPAAKEALDPDLRDRDCLATSTLVVGPSQRAATLRDDPNSQALFSAASPRLSPPPEQGSTEHSISGEGSRRRRDERDLAADGSIATLTIDISATTAQ